MSSDEIQFFDIHLLPYTPGAASHYHLYEDDDTGTAACYVDGQALCAGEWYEVVKEVLTRVGVKLIKIDGADLWKNPTGGGYDVASPDETDMDPSPEAKKRRRIKELRRELAELEGEPDRWQRAILDEQAAWLGKRTTTDPE